MSILINHFWNSSSVVVPWSPKPPSQPDIGIELMPLGSAPRVLHASVSEGFRHPSASSVSSSPVKKQPTALIDDIVHAERDPRLLKTALHRVEKGDINLDGTDDKGQTPVYLATQGGYLNLVKALIQQKADLNKPSLFRRTPLHAAASKPTPDIAAVLLAAGVQASINSEDCIGRRPLHYAAWRGHSQTVEKLLQADADPNPQDISGRTPLDYVLRELNDPSPLFNNQLQTLKHLLHHNANCGSDLVPDNPTEKPDPDTINALSAVLRQACDQPKQDIELITLLLQQPYVTHPDEGRGSKQEPADTESYKNYRKAVAQIAKRRKIFPFYRENPLIKRIPSSQKSQSSMPIQSELSTSP